MPALGVLGVWSLRGPFLRCGLRALVAWLGESSRDLFRGLLACSLYTSALWREARSVDQSP